MLASVKARSMSFSANPDLVSSVDSYCAKRGCSRSWFVSTAVKNYLAECLEDQEDYETAAAAWNAFEKSGGKTFTSDELRKEFGL